MTVAAATTIYFMAKTNPSKLNVFASPWKNSDVVLVVQEVEFHVHRSILSAQSPVFETMLTSSDFKEATQDEITLEGKKSDDMLEFLKLLYPPGMIKGTLISLDGNNIVRMLALADEYQTVDVMERWLEDAHIDAGNALKILPYAERYKSTSAREKCIDTIKRHISTTKLDLTQQNEDTKAGVLFAKCEFLESIVITAQTFIPAFMTKVFQNKESGPLYSVNVCNHTISIGSFHNVRKCEICLFRYKERFLDQLKLVSTEHKVSTVGYTHKPESSTFSFGIPSPASPLSNTSPRSLPSSKLLKLLTDMDDVKTSSV